MTMLFTIGEESSFRSLTSCIRLYAIYYIGLVRSLFTMTSNYPLFDGQLTLIGRFPASRMVKFLRCDCISPLVLSCKCNTLLWLNPVNKHTSVNLLNLYREFDKLRTWRTTIISFPDPVILVVIHFETVIRLCES
jgi:hypothetical protein